jgi:hypothetical protein
MREQITALLFVPLFVLARRKLFQTKKKAECCARRVVDLALHAQIATDFSFCGGNPGFHFFSELFEKLNTLIIFFQQLYSI